MRILVTGGAGFIGSHIVDELMSRGYAVTVLDNMSAKGKDNLRAHDEDKNFRFIKGDIQDNDAIRKSLTDADVVVHQAAMVSAPRSVEEPKITHKINVDGTLSFLEASLRAGVKRFVFASSCAIYGNPKQLPVTEDTPPNPLTPYAQTKLTSEKHCREYNLKGLPTVALRYFNVYGPRQSHGKYSGVMMKLVECIKTETPPTIYGGGEQTRDFVYVGDVARAVLLAIEKDKAVGEAMNIGTGNSVTINELCELFLRLAKKSHLKPIYKNARPGDVYRTQADISKAREILGFEPATTLKEGVKKLLKSEGVLIS